VGNIAVAVCVSCQQRKGKRTCPALSGDICPQCCGEKREESIACPLMCEHLVESRLHEKTVVDPSIRTFPEVEVTDQFMQRNRSLVQLLATGTAMAALGVEGAVDRDVREALDSLAASYRTREASGLIYDSRPANPYAEQIRQSIEKTIDSVREKLREQQGMYTIRDADILGSLVFLVRLAAVNNNGRSRGKSFLHVVLGMAAEVMGRMEPKAE